MASPSRIWFPVALLAVWIGMAPLQKSIDRDRARYHLVESGELETVRDLLLQAFSDFRIVLSNFLWIRVDEYLHLGFVKEQIEEKLAGKTPREHEEEELGHPHVHPESGAESQHAAMESQIMPLIRIVTWLDPHFILAYQVGAWTLADRLKLPKEAADFLMEGVRRNPNRYELFSELGFVYFFYLKDYPDAAAAFTRALQLPIADFMEKKKLIRMLAYCYEKSGETEKAVKILEEYVKIDPQNGKARQRLERLKEKIK